MLFLLEQNVDTQQMLENISRSFVTQTNLITENWIMWCIFLLFIIGIVALFIIVKKKTPVAYFTTHGSNFVKKLLENVKEQETIVDVQIESLEQLHAVQMVTVHVSDKVFMLRSMKAVVVENTKSLEDKKVRCSVLSTIKGERGYYVLIAKIVHAVVVDSLLELTVVLPNNVEKIQRREHLRIEPKDEYILGIALWSEKVANGMFVNTPEQWGSPEYRYIPGKVNQVRLLNISASGAKMIIGVDSNSPKLNLDKRCIMLIDIWEPEVQQKVRYWIRCAEQNLFKIKDKNAIEIGVRFREWTTTPLHDDSLHFVLVSKDGEIPPLANWIMKRYLEEYREQPITQSLLTTS